MEYRYRYHDAEYAVTLDRQPDGSYLARIGDRSYRVEAAPRPDGELSLIVDGKRLAAHVATRKTRTGIHHYVALAGRETRVFELGKPTGSTRRAGGATGSAGGLTAQMPGQVTQVFVAEGDTVSEGQPLMLLEAMKMEIRVAAPSAGVVARILVTAGQSIEREQALIEIQPLE